MKPTTLKTKTIKNIYSASQFKPTILKIEKMKKTCRYSYSASQLKPTTQKTKKVKKHLLYVTNETYNSENKDDKKHLLCIPI